MSTLEKKRPELDGGQKEAVRCEGNAVVSAGAGSGKTTVLAERYVRLVKEGFADVEQILTLTYTRKAAAEMYERIHARLLEEADDPRIKEQIARFDRAQISTLDSFCVQVVRNSPQYFGVRSDFSLGEEQTSRTDEETALAFILDHSDDPALLSFIDVNGFESVWKELFASLGSSYLHLAQRRDFDSIYMLQIRELERIVAESVAALDKLGRSILALDGAAAKAVSDGQAALRAAPDLARFLDEERFEELAAAADAIKLSKRYGRASSPDVDAYKELTAEHDQLRERIVSAALTLASRDTMKRLFELCDEYQELLLTKKRMSGALSFQDVVEMAVRLLTDNHALRRFYKQRYRYLMIDEFQDNNELQKRLLYLLAEREGNESDEPPGVERVDRDKLFFVGDEKQSIYRFRGADVAVFRGLKLELEASGGRAISLATNYRSAPLLIEFYNRFFEKVFGTPEEEFEAGFEPLSAGLSADEASSIRLFRKPYDGPPAPDEAHSDDAEAYYIARFIKTSVERGSVLIREGARTRPAVWEDFALLMRTTSNQIRYERIFRRLGIPYATQSMRTLFLEAPLNDIYSALQLAAYPDDRGAYAALLRSPFVNLADRSVVRVILAGGEPFAASAETLDLEGEEAEKLAAGGELYRHLRAAMDAVPICTIIDDLWYRFGYRYTILRDSSYHPYLEYYDYFRELAVRADRDGQSIVQFLDLLRPNLGKYEKLSELEVVRDQSAGVQMLTVHKAKGLEFPIVILANSGNLGRSGREGSSPYYLSDQYGLTLRITEKDNYFYKIAKEENDRKESAELKRLLYVALTRARSHLIISGCHNRQNRSSSEVLLNMVMTTLGPDGTPPAAEEWAPSGLFGGVVDERIGSISEVELLARHSAPSPRRLSELADDYERAETVGWEADRSVWTASELSARVWSVLTEPSAAEGLFPAALDAAEQLPAIASDPVIAEEKLETAFGSLVHAVIERRLDGSPNPTLRDLPASILRNIDEREAGALLADALALAEGFLSSELGRRALDAPRRFTERSFLMRCGEKRSIRGSFDLLFEDADGPCVVDFKTDRELAPEAHAAQLHAYRLAAGELLGAPSAGWLFYVRGARSVEVSDSLLAPSYDRYLELVGRGGSAPGAARDGSVPPGERVPPWPDGGADRLAEVLDAVAAHAGTQPDDREREEEASLFE